MRENKPFTTLFEGMPFLCLFSRAIPLRKEDPEGLFWPLIPWISRPRDNGVRGEGIKAGPS